MNLKSFKITFEDIFENVESEEQAIDVLLDYLQECVRYEDVTAFKFEEVKEEQLGTTYFCIKCGILYAEEVGVEPNFICDDCAVLYKLK